MKKCRKCEEIKVLSEFGRHSGKKDGLDIYCKSCIRERTKEYNAKNKEKKTASSKAYRDANRDKTRAAAKAWYELNKDRERESFSKRFMENPEKIRGFKRAWKKENPCAVRIHSQNRRARKNASGGRLSNGITEKLHLLQKGKCACCRERLSETGYHIDHIIPIALQGDHDDFNVQLLCPACNLSKGAKHPIDFMQSRGSLL